MIVLNAIFPIIALLGAGWFLKNRKITDDRFLTISDQLVYYIFFPAMLFWKTSTSPARMDMAVDLCLAGIAAVGIVYLVSLILIKILPVPRFQAGSFSQVCFRFNTYIGMAVVMNTLGEEGARYFAILIGFAIPAINVMAVSTLIWYSEKKESPGKTLKRLVKALVANPLILACAAGILFGQTRLMLPSFIDNTFRLLTAAAMPLALISIGGALNTTGVREHFKLSLISSLIKGLALPVIGYLVLSAFGVRGTAFNVGILFFALPTSTAIYVLSSQLHSDTSLASAAIMISTLVSFFPLSLAILLFF